MIIKRMTIKNFGRLKNRTMEFSPGINLLYGENESGKTTAHTFVKSMLYGIQRQRGRAAKKDAYSIYLPWDSPGDYGGILWFENGGKTFRLNRNFYKENPSAELYCEDDGEILDVEAGDLEAVLGGISETVYENTVSVAQLKSATGAELVREVQNYMASYQGAGDSSVNLDRTMQMLKMSRKGYQVQADKRKKENEREREKLSQTMDYLEAEIASLDEKSKKLAGREEALQSDGAAKALEESMQSLVICKRRLGIVAAAALVLGIVGSAGIAAGFRDVLLAMIPGILGILAAAAAFVLRLKVGEKIISGNRQKERLLSKKEKLDWSLNHLNEERREKEIALQNAAEEYREAEEHAYLPLAEETEVEALNLAMEVIQGLSGNIHSQVGSLLRRRISEILGEITGGKYTEILIDGELHITVNAGERIVPLEGLSRGTVEQVYFALRMAAGELLCGQEQLPVFLDEVFGMYDEERLTLALKWLAKENRQVIISSCRNREEEILQKCGLAYHKIVL